MQCTLNLNNRAVALYRSNDISEAAKTYYESLCLVQELLKKCPQEEIMDCEADRPSQHEHTTRTKLPRHECFHTAVQIQASCDVSMHDNFFVYRNALFLQECSSTSPEHRVQSRNIYCAGILLNTAILHHQKSIKSGTSASLHRAEQLYQACLQLIAGLSTTNDTVALIAIAGTNNLAHIEYDKGMMMQASERLRFLVRLLSSSDNTPGRVVTTEEFNGMLSNALLANGMAASPAA